MSRIRTMKPEWLDDDRLLECTNAARLLTVALVLLSDDSGRGRWGVASKARAFPADPSQAGPAFDELAPWFARRYRVRGQVYYRICNWSKHQKIDRPSKPRTPDPAEGEWIDLSHGPGSTREGLANVAEDTKKPNHAKDPARESIEQGDAGEGARDRGGLVEDSSSIHLPANTDESTGEAPRHSSDTEYPRRGLVERSSTDLDLDRDLDRDLDQDLGTSKHRPPPQDPLPPRARARVSMGGGGGGSSESVSAGDLFVEVEGLPTPIGAEDVFALFADAWGNPDRSAPYPSASNIRRMGEVLRWLATLPPAERLQNLEASVRGASKRIKNAKSPIAVWASDPATFAQIPENEGDDQGAAELATRAEVSRLLAECDELADSDDPEDLATIEAHGRKIQEIRR